MTSRREFMSVVPALVLPRERWAAQVPAGAPGVVDVRTHGARGAGTGDDTAALQAAIDACAAGGGGMVFLPRGTYPITAQIRVPAFVRVVGVGGEASRIVAAPRFPTDTALVRIGNGKDYAYSCGLEHLVIECSHVYGSTGVFSSDLQENGGVSNVVINSYHRHAVHLDGAQGIGISNWYLQNLHLMASSGAPKSTAILINAGSWKNRVENISIVPHTDVANSQGAAILVRGGKLNAHGVHIEYHDDGVVFDEGSHGSVSDVDGEYVNTLVRIRGGGRVVVVFAFRSHGDAVLVNEHRKETLREAALCFYAQDGGGDAAYTTSRSIPTSLGDADLATARIGGGATLAGFLSGTADWTPPQVDSGAAAAVTVAVPGARAGDTVAVGFSQPLPPGTLLSGSVSAADTVTVTFANLSGKRARPANGTVRADVWRHQA